MRPAPMGTEKSFLGGCREEGTIGIFHPQMTQKFKKVISNTCDPKSEKTFVSAREMRFFFKKNENSQKNVKR